MSLINEAYINAILADAAYNLEEYEQGLTGDDLRKVLIERMTEPLATYIAKNFDLVTNIDSNEYLSSGFDAAVWENISTGEVYVSMRGTDGVQDIFNDIDLTIDGAAAGQIIDMVNWWLKNTASVGEYAMQIGYIGTTLVQMSPVAGTGLLSGITNITVNGHSLGGHLATAFTRIFGQQWTVDHTYTFNSAGFLPESEPFFSQIQALLGDGVGLEGFADATEQTNFFAMYGINVTTRTLFNNQIGMREPLFNEQSSGVFTYENHFMNKLTDSLALANTVSQLDHSFDFEKMNALFSAISSYAESSLETMLSALQEIVTGSVTPISDREEYYRTLSSLESSDEFAAWSGRINIFPLVDRDIDGNLVAREVSRIIDTASMENDLGRAYRNALAGLQPFVLLGDPDIYLSRFSEQQTALYDEANSPGGMTNSFISDRATMLHILINRNLEDISVSLSSPYEDKDTTYEDIASATLFTTNPLTGDVQQLRSHDKQSNRQIIFGGNEDNSGAGSIQGGQKGDHLYGMGGNDEIFGHAGDDYIEGNAGDDRINGGQGDDELIGGLGHDYYRYEADSGHDVIAEVDEDNGLKAGRINHFSASGDIVTLINGGISQVGSETWQSLDGKVTYQLLGSLEKDLLITFQGESGSVRVQDFSNGDLGINLGSIVDLDTPVTSNDVLGDANGPATDEYLHGSAGNDYIYGGYGYDILIGNDGDDVLDGGEHADELLGGNDNDLLMGGSGNDVLQGESGLDHLQGDAGDDRLFSWNAFLYRDDETLTEGDILEGGSGSDVLQGSIGNDQLYANSKADLEQALNSDALSASPYERDFLSGGDGDDLLVGGLGHDFLGGASGDDYLVGGAGNDIILGDYELRTNSLDWDVYQSNTYFFNYSNVIRHSLVGTGDDIVHAGGGDDLVHGDRGDDIIHGNAGDDILRGGDGEDYLYGGEGNDVLWGENHNDVVHGGWGNDQLSGHGGNDDLYGNEGDDKLYGHAGNDLLHGGEGADYLRGHAGNDSYFGGAGNDHYHFYAVDGGVDRIRDDGGNDLVQISDVGVTYDSIDVTKTGNDLVIQLNGADSITIGDWFLGPEYQVENFRLYETSYSGDEIEGLAFSPKLVKSVDDVTIDQGDVYSLVLPGDMFTDIDDDHLVIDVSMADGSALLPWLWFDQATQTLSGMPGNEDVGMMDIRITAVDASGKSASDLFTISVNNINDAPTLAEPINDQFASEDVYFSFSLGPKLFNDIDQRHGDTLAITFSQLDGSDLPSWLSIDTTTNTISGIAANDDVGNYEIVISATDMAGESVSGQFTLSINNTNDSPVFVESLVDQNAIVGHPFSYALEPTILHDDDLMHGDWLTLSASLTDQTDLPGWINFDPAEWTFTGTPDSQSSGVLDIQLTAADQSGASVSSNFNLLVQGSAPINQSGSKDDDELAGSIYADTLRGAGGNDRLFGGDDSDQLIGGNGDDELVGGAGDDTLKGSAGNDVLLGGPGNDLLYGGRHNDRYYFDVNDGMDAIYESHGDDVLVFGEGIDVQDIWFSQVGNNLQINLVDAHDQVIIDGWYKNSSYQVERFETDSGAYLMSSQVDQLVQAMSVFDPALPGEFNPDASRQEQMEQTIAAAWTTA